MLLTGRLLLQDRHLALRLAAVLRKRSGVASLVLLAETSIFVDLDPIVGSPPAHDERELVTAVIRARLMPLAPLGAVKLLYAALSEGAEAHVKGAEPVAAMTGLGTASSRAELACVCPELSLPLLSLQLLLSLMLVVSPQVC